MHPDLSRCAASTTDKKIVFRAGKTNICFNNPDQRLFQKILVDGCVIKDIERVDHALCCENHGDLLIELKGGHVEKACAQVESTINRWKANGYSQGSLSALVVSTRRPNISTEVQIKARRILKSFGVVTVFKNSGKELEVEQFLPATKAKNTKAKNKSVSSPKTRRKK